MNVDAKKVWGKHVVSIRKRHNLSQEELAHQLWTNQTTISRWERCLTKPTYRMQKKIASLYGSPLEAGDPAALDMIYEIAQQFVQAQTVSTMLYDRGYILRAFKKHSSHIAVGKHMAETARPCEVGLIQPFAELMESIGFWDTPDRDYTYHVPALNESLDNAQLKGKPFFTVRLNLRSIGISHQPFMLITPKLKTIQVKYGSEEKEYYGPEPFDLSLPKTSSAFIPLNVYHVFRQPSEIKKTFSTPAHRLLVSDRFYRILPLDKQAVYVAHCSWKRLGGPRHNRLSKIECERETWKPWFESRDQRPRLSPVEKGPRY